MLIDVVNPDEKEINFLTSNFSIEPDFIRASLDEDETSRIECERHRQLYRHPVSEVSENGIDYFTVQQFLLPTGM